MANLEFCNKHSMVAYLKKPTRSDGFQEIVDFLNGSHVRYALTKNPTIYVSLIEKFWQTATERHASGHVFRPGPVWGCDRLVSEPVMAISVISVSSDSSEDSTDTRVIPAETLIIAPTIPPSPDYTPASPDYSPASDSESDPSEDPSSDHIPPLPAILPFLSSANDTTDSDTPDTPPSPTHGTPFTKITSST
ncbi:hypothetical protein Tco_1383296 [Tanacetum coccineum]